MWKTLESVQTIVTNTAHNAKFSIKQISEQTKEDTVCTSHYPELWHETHLRAIFDLIRNQMQLNTVWNIMRNMSFFSKSSGMLKEHSGNCNWVWMVIFKLQSDLFQTLTSDLQGLYCGCCMCPCVYRTSEHYKQKHPFLIFPHVMEWALSIYIGAEAETLAVLDGFGMGVQWPWWGEGKTTHPVRPQHPAEVQSRISERLFFLYCHEIVLVHSRSVLEAIMLVCSWNQSSVFTIFPSKWLSFLYKENVIFRAPGQ